jgi:hypothetical protein
MSRSNPTETLVNPSSKFYSWDSDNACFKYFDKSLGEKDSQGKAKGQNVLVPLPFNFIVLDQLACVRGYNEPQQKSYYSNEVRNITNDIVTVKSGKGNIEKSGTYEQVKTLLGAKYCQSVYIGFKNAQKKLEIQNIQLTGAALNAFIDFVKTVKIYEIAVSVNKSVKKKKGRNEYNEPIFTAMKISDAVSQEAIELDKELQAYLTAYLARNASSTPQPANTSTQASEQPKSTVTASNVSMDEVGEEPAFGGEDSDDLPF